MPQPPDAAMSGLADSQSADKGPSGDILGFIWIASNDPPIFGCWLGCADLTTWGLSRGHRVLGKPMPGPPVQDGGPNEDESSIRDAKGGADEGAIQL
jgi:hypothetical protein